MGSLLTEPSQLPFPCYKSVPFPLLLGDLHVAHMVAGPDCTSLLIPDKPIFAGEMSCRLLLFQVNRGNGVAMFSTWTQGQERGPTEREE